MIVLIIVSTMCIYMIRRERLAYLEVKRKSKKYSSYKTNTDDER